MILRLLLFYSDRYISRRSIALFCIINVKKNLYLSQYNTIIEPKIDRNQISK